jgi:hypothetical protein
VSEEALTRLVSWEVGKHGEGTFNGTIGHDLSHDLLLITVDGIGSVTIALVVIVTDFVTTLTGALTLGSGTLSRARHTSAIHMMFTRFERVSTAALHNRIVMRYQNKNRCMQLSSHLVRSILASSHKTSVTEVLPSCWRKASIASRYMYHFRNAVVNM